MFVKMPRCKRLFLLISLLVISMHAIAKTYYVATNGNNSNSGTLSQPWLTWRYAFTTAKSGDTVFFRGGTYPFEGSVNIRIGNSGTHDNPICFFNYPNEVPILDFSNRINGAFSYALVVGSGQNYLHFKGLTFRNMIQSSDVYIAGIVGGDNIGVIFENMTVHGIGGPGYSFGNVDSLTFINCDTFDCYDPFNDGGNGDGFQVNNISTRGVTNFIGCRAWRCSDDGFDNFNNNGIVNYSYCWAMNCGYPEGDGNGFKIGMTSLTALNTTQRSLTNCIAIDNPGAGFTENHAIVNANFYNNVSFRNGANGNFYDAGFVNFGDGLIGGAKYVNNISYLDNHPFFWPENNKQISEYNSWNNSVSLNADDFISLETSQLYGPRQSDGSLPKVNFMQLAAGSDLIDSGKDVGLPFEGSAPDIGWHESSGSTTTASPVYVNAVVENMTPSRLEMTFNLTLANIVPAASAFSVMVNSSLRSVNSVTISGTKVLLSLATPVVFGDIVTVAYTKPTLNPLQTASGGQAASVTSRNVTNNVAAVIPVYVSSVIENATPSTILITFNLLLANIVPVASSFSVMINSSLRSVSSVTISGTKVLLSLANPVVFGDVVTVAYTKPASNPIQTASGGIAASITAQNVTNYVAAVNNQPPIVSISSPTKSTAFIAPATITIDANASDPDGSVTKVEFFNGASKLGEITSAPYSYTWKEVPAGTYSITAAATDNKGLKTVSTAVTVVVEKSTTTVNQLPSVSIKIPNEKKPKKHENVVIVAEATDPDGTISMVELKNGNVTIAKLSIAPYVFTLQNVDTGNYVITAIATDNLGAINISDEIEFRVENLYNPDLISLYPNPNNGFFKIDILEKLPDQECTLSVISMTGTTVYQDKVKPGEAFKEIERSDLQSGQYVLMLTNGKAILTTKKFIKQ